MREKERQIKKDIKRRFKVHKMKNIGFVTEHLNIINFNLTGKSPPHKLTDLAKTSRSSSSMIKKMQALAKTDKNLYKRLQEWLSANYPEMGWFYSTDEFWKLVHNK